MVHRHHSHICGTTTVGERGQVVIPADIRKRMELKTGDKMLVFCRKNQMVGLIKANNFSEFVDSMTERMIKKMQTLKKRHKD